MAPVVVVCLWRRRTAAGQAWRTGEKGEQMRVRQLVGVAVVVASALGVGSAVAGAQYGRPYESFGITVSPRSPAPGSVARVTASGYRPGTEVTILISASKCPRTLCADLRVLYVRLGEARANANGVATDQVTIPSTFAPGSTHIVEARGVRPNGAPLTETKTIELASRHRR